MSPPITLESLTLLSTTPRDGSCDDGRCGCGCGLSLLPVATQAAVPLILLAPTLKGSCGCGCDGSYGCGGGLPR